MRLATKVLGLTAGATATTGAVVTACATCCAVPVLGSVLAAIGLAGLGTVAVGWVVGLAVLLLAATIGLVIVRHRAAAGACAPSTGPACSVSACGCGSMPSGAVSGGRS
ncbi:hypothetical protein [Pseudoroseomonas ludipueritiae]|uniref:Mercuric ion transport protein n=1 Tax=Pseudoroseomonas ludipueritiae TaxID=198093 RepID=A0ABR7R2T6_9PROT|nr:hypothetical protein [Pseudoroseomonas ludipueritiae]MBC9175992.1 hypothetical protein [Pseudoroseomonas ludipueritiae]